MALRRRIFRIGSSKVVTIPGDWLDWLKAKYGKEPEEVDIEVNNELTIRPVIR